jgi:1-acyl-sn-glycerol-3-phosphate acyltransferase
MAMRGPTKSESGVRLFARALLALFFRRVEVTGTENLPAAGGGMLLAWHPNGLIDPALLLATFPGRVVFGARHGLFRWPLLGRILAACAVPIFRRQDLRRGADEAALRRGNDASLAALAEAIREEGFAVLFPEGDSHDEPHPLALRTGAARLYLDARDRFAGEGEVRVIPVGLHYDRKRFFRSRALVAYLPPLDLATETAGYEDGESGRREAARRITTRFAAVLDQAVLATDDWREHYLIHRLRRVMRAERAARAGGDPGPADMRERHLGFARVWTAFRDLRRTAPEAVETLRARIETYDRRLRRLGLEDFELDHPAPLPHGRVLAALAFQRLVVDLLLPPLVLLGLVANLPTALLLAGIVKIASKRKKDQATIKLLAGFVLFPATWLLLGALAYSSPDLLHALVPEIPDLPWLRAVVTFLLAGLGGVLILSYGRISRSWGRALLVRFRRSVAPWRVRWLLRERAAIFETASTLAADLALPGFVDAHGRVLDRASPDAN